MPTHLNRTWLAVAFVLSFSLLAVHLYALQEYMYWHHRWLDIPMHIVGGAALGALIMAFGTTRRTSFYFACIFLLIVGWEVFEYVGHISTGQPDYWIDTTKDIMDGFIGSGISLFLARKTTWR